MLRIDPETNKVTQTINVGNGPGAIAVGLGSVWVANTLDGTVSRIDAKTGTVIGLVQVGEGPRDIAVARGAVWVANEFGGTVSRIDPRTNNVRLLDHHRQPAHRARGRRATPSGRPFGPSGGAHRGGTFTFAYASNPIDSIDPADLLHAAILADLELDRRRADRLQTRRRLGGDNRRPRPGDRPADADRQRHDVHVPTSTAASATQPARSSSQRTSAPPSSATSSSVRPADYYSGIVGASACTKGRHCNLSHGIIVAGDTIVFHLVAPDPEFLQKLALPFAYVRSRIDAAPERREAGRCRAPDRTQSSDMTPNGDSS